MINPLTRSSPVRMTGMASGMDTDMMIQQMMRVHQMRIDNQMRSRTLLQWRADTHTEIRDTIQGFQRSFLTSMGPQAMLNRNVFNANAATVMGRHSDAVSVRALGGSAVGLVNIGRISQLASGARARTENENIRQFFRGVQGTDRLDTLGASLADSGFSLNAADRNANITIGTGASAVSTTVNEAAVRNLDWENADVLTRFSISGVQGQVTLTRHEATQDTPHHYTFSVGQGDSEVTGTLTFVPGVDGEGNAITETVVTFDSELPDDATAAQIAARTALEQGLGQISRDETTGETYRGTTVMNFWEETTMKVDGQEAPITIARRENADGSDFIFGHNNRTLDFFNQQTIRINNSDITIRSNMTFNQVMTAVNNSGAGVRASFESATGRFNLESLTTGADSTLDLSGNGGTTSNINASFFAALGFEVPQGGNGSMVFTGNDAKVILNGDEVTSSSNTINFGGVAITLNRTTLDVPAGEENIVVNISRDTDGAVNRIREFVDAYNSIIQRIESLTRERKAPHEVSYGPLTQEEKSMMTDRQIEEWETIARRGIMRNDSALQNLATSLRRELFVTVESAGFAPHQIGLTTGSFHGGTGGQIVLDEDRLRAALEEDPERVANVFAGTEENRGLLWRMNDVMSSYVSANGSGSRAIRSLEDSIRRNSEQVTRLQTRMFAEEDRLLRQFAAMETAMARMQSQGDWFNSMLGTQR